MCVAAVSKSKDVWISPPGASRERSCARNRQRCFIDGAAVGSMPIIAPLGPTIFAAESSTARISPWTAVSNAGDPPHV